LAAFLMDFMQYPEFISSVSNDKVRFVKNLKNKEARDESGLFVVEGGNIVRDLAGSSEPLMFFTTKRREEEFSEVFLRFPNVAVYTLSDKAFAAASESESPFGVLAVLKKPQKPFQKPIGNALILDGVSDPGNLGTIFRTAAAAGFSDVYLLECADAYSGKTVRASQGAVLSLNIFEIDLTRALDIATSTYSVALDASGRRDLEEKPPPVTLILGSEAHGIRPALLAAASATMSIPMKAMESLNVAVAAGIAMYKFFRY